MKTFSQLNDGDNIFVLKRIKDQDGYTIGFEKYIIKVKKMFDKSVSSFGRIELEDNVFDLKYLWVSEGDYGIIYFNDIAGNAYYTFGNVWADKLWISDEEVFKQEITRQYEHYRDINQFEMKKCQKRLDRLFENYINLTEINWD